MCVCVSVSAFSIFALTMCVHVVFVLSFNELLNVLWRNSNDVSQHLHVNTDTIENALTLIKRNLIFNGSLLHCVYIYVSINRAGVLQAKAYESILTRSFARSLLLRPPVPSQFISFSQ